MREGVEREVAIAGGGGCEGGGEGGGVFWKKDYVCLGGYEPSGDALAVGSAIKEDVEGSPAWAGLEMAYRRNTEICANKILLNVHNGNTPCSVSAAYNHRPNDAGKGSDSRATTHPNLKP